MEAIIPHLLFLLPLVCVSVKLIDKNNWHRVEGKGEANGDLKGVPTEGCAHWCDYSKPFVNLPQSRDCHIQVFSAPGSDHLCLSLHHVETQEEIHRGKVQSILGGMRRASADFMGQVGDGAGNVIQEALCPSFLLAPDLQTSREEWAEKVHRQERSGLSGRCQSHLGKLGPPCNAFLFSSCHSTSCN